MKKPHEGLPGWGGEGWGALGWGNDEPVRDEVLTRGAAWLLEWCEPTKKADQTISSYTLKHVLEAKAFGVKRMPRTDRAILTLPGLNLGWVGSGEAAAAAEAAGFVVTRPDPKSPNGVIWARWKVPSLAEARARGLISDGYGRKT